MKKIDGPEDAKQKIAANVDYEKPGSAATKNDEGSKVPDGTEDLKSQQSNALSNDISGSTQFVNLDAKEAGLNSQEIPDSENTKDVDHEDDKIEKDQLGPMAGGPSLGNEGTGKKNEVKTGELDERRKTQNSDPDLMKNRRV